jgi:hypothetical protein
MLVKYNRLFGIRHHGSVNFFPGLHKTELSGIRPDGLS